MQTAHHTPCVTRTPKHTLTDTHTPTRRLPHIDAGHQTHLRVQAPAHSQQDGTQSRDGRPASRKQLRNLQQQSSHLISSADTTCGGHSHIRQPDRQVLQLATFGSISKAACLHNPSLWSTNEKCDAAARATQQCVPDTTVLTKLNPRIAMACPSASACHCTALPVQVIPG